MSFKHAMSFISFMLQLGYLICSEWVCFQMISADRITVLRRVSKRLVAINCLAVKVFQALALNENLIDHSIHQELLQYVDQAPWNLCDIDYASLIEITDKYQIDLPDGWEKPINAGMISLVYKGYRRSTQEIVMVKIKRKDIDKRLQYDINNIVGLLYLLSFIPKLNPFQLVDIVNRNITLLQNQTNFLQEVDNMIRIRNNCIHLKYVRIPNVERSITESYPNVIVMECINGLKIDQVADEDYDKFAKQVVKFGIVTTVMHGVVHGDLHCGNILFMKDSEDPKYPHKIGVIDFGIVYEMGDKFKDTLFELFTNVFQEDSRVTAEKILTSRCFVEPAGIMETIPRKYYLYMLSLLDETIAETIAYAKAANQMQIYKVINYLYDYINSNPEFQQWGIKPSSDLVKSQMMLAMAHGVTLRLCHGDFMSLMDEVIRELFPFAISGL